MRVGVVASKAENAGSYVVMKAMRGTWLKYMYEREMSQTEKLEGAKLSSGKELLNRGAVTQLCPGILPRPSLEGKMVSQQWAQLQAFDRTRFLSLNRVSSCWDTQTTCIRRSTRSSVLDL